MFYNIKINLHIYEICINFVACLKATATAQIKDIIRQSVSVRVAATLLVDLFTNHVQHSIY
jgi:hypothetical protein